MANRTLLLAQDDREAPTEYEPGDAVLGANYSVPLFWLSMFGSSDLVDWRSTLDPDVSSASLVADASTCFDRSTKRLSTWGRRWPALAEAAEAWLTFVRQAEARYFAVWTEELAEMFPSADSWRATLRGYVDALEDVDSSSFADVLGQSYLQAGPAGSGELVVTTGDPITLVVCGYSWGARATWELP